jgi:putative glutamine amidotransferase
MIVGIPACAKSLGPLGAEMPFHQTPARYAQAVLGCVGALPVLIPPLGEPMLGLLDELDGLLVPGSTSNVHPRHYEGGDSETPDLHDLERDHTTLPLIRAAIAGGIPVLAICRGIQELNVALGGSLFQRVHVQPGMSDHRGGLGAHEIRYGPKHPITVSGSLARLVQADRIEVNSLHGQAMPSARGWLLGVQWHPEWTFAANPHSVAIFTAFGDACRIRRRDRAGTDRRGG